MTQGFRASFSNLYTDFVETPELTKFRRYIGPWSWILNNHVAVIERKLKECHDAIADVHGMARERSVIHVTDYHRAYDTEEHPILKILMEDLTNLIRKYSMSCFITKMGAHANTGNVGQDLVLAHKVASMPEQDLVFARHFAENDSLFDGGVYGPTKEDADMYRQVPCHSDLCSLKGREQEDPGTNLVLKHLKPMYKLYRKVISWILRRPLREDTDPEYAHLSTVRTAMHFLASIHVIVLFTGTLGVLNSLDSDAKRIAVLGCFACVLLWSLILLIPSLKRNDLFSIAVAYFAVGGIFIGSRGRDSC
jgi:hypothetical protein